MSRELTPQMVAAGARALALAKHSDDLQAAVRYVWHEMETERKLGELEKAMASYELAVKAIRKIA